MKKILKRALLLCGTGFLVFAVALCALLFWPLSNAPTLGKFGQYAIVGVNVVNVSDGTINANRTVLIEHGKIANIIPSDARFSLAAYQRIPAKNKFLIPGLWDMHTHSYALSPQVHHPLYMANGVTSVRDMSGCMDKKDSYWACPANRLQWTKESLQGNRVAPRYILQSSYQTNGGNEVPADFPDYFRLETAQHAQELVEYYASAGVDFVKTYSELSPQQYASLARAVSDSELYLAGHKPISVSLTQAIASQQRSIEHGRLFLFECYAFIDQFRKLDNPIRHYNSQLMWRMLNNQDEATCHSLMQQMAASDTWWVPTLSTLKMSALSREPEFREDPRLDEIPFILKSLIWFPDANRAASSANDETGRFVHQAFYQRAQQLVSAASTSGVKLLAGSDASDTYVFIGSGLHDELENLARAGLSPLHALQAATISAAQFSGMEDQLGSIEIGKLADLVLLDADPLHDISNVRDIAGVMLNGHYYDKAALYELKEFAKAQAGKITLNVQYLWSMLASPLMRQQLAD